MCAIVGSYRTDIDMSKALEILKHRGPDFQNSVKEGDFNIGHCRLSILDLSSLGNQPFQKDKATLSFNGEIWNYNEVKEEYNFKTKSSSDTEVLINILNEKGTEALDIIDGMYAFAYISPDLKILVRDKIGEVPLFYIKTTSGMIWSSERKAIIEYSKTPKDIKEFPAGTYYNFDTCEFIKYYNYPALSQAEGSPEKVNQIIKSAVEKRLHSDVPVAILVSGGLDSSIIATEVIKLHPNICAYTIVFDDESQDLINARKFCKEKNITLKEIKVPNPVVKDIEDTVYDIETNMKTQIEIAVLCDKLAKAISDDGYKVILSGEGADEVFGGYGNTSIKYSLSDDDEYRQVKIDLVSKMSRGNFLRGNLIFLKYGIEIRLPFVDMDLIDYVVPLTKDASKINKRLLKDAYKDEIPEYIIKRVKKTFQGEAGVSKYILENLIEPGDSPVKLYNRTYNKVFQNNQDIEEW